MWHCPVKRPPLLSITEPSCPFSKQAKHSKFFIHTFTFFYLLRITVHSLLTWTYSTLKFSQICILFHFHFYRMYILHYSILTYLLNLNPRNFTFCITFFHITFYTKYHTPYSLLNPNSCTQCIVTECHTNQGQLFTNS